MRLPMMPGAGLELPEHVAGPRVHRLDPSVHRAVEDHVAAGRRARPSTPGTSPGSANLLAGTGSQAMNSPRLPSRARRTSSLPRRRTACRRCSSSRRPCSPCTGWCAGCRAARCGARTPPAASPWRRWTRGRCSVTFTSAWASSPGPRSGARSSCRCPVAQLIGTNGVRRRAPHRSRGRTCTTKPFRSEVDEHLARLAVDRQIEQDVLVDAVVVPLVVGRRLVGPRASPVSGSRAKIVVTTCCRPGAGPGSTTPGLPVP